MASTKRLRSRVKVVSKVAQLDAELQKASDRLVVLEFFSETYINTSLPLIHN